MIIQKIPIIAELSAAGYNPARIRREKLIGQRELTKLRAGGVPSHGLLDTLCRLLNCQPGDLLAYVPDDQPAEPAPDQPAPADHADDKN